MSEHSDHGQGDSSNGLESRLCAFEVLKAVLVQKKALDFAFADVSSFRDLPSIDRGFVRMLVSTLLRRLGQIDDLIARTEERPGRMSADVQLILRIGAVQIFFMDVPDHAAVDSAVNLAEHLGYDRQKGFVNGSLRSLVRSGQEWLSRQDPVRLNTPEWLLKLWIEDYGLGMAAQIAQAHLTEAPLDITLKDGADCQYFEDIFQASTIGRGSLRRVSGGRIEELEGYDEGRWWVQDASAALPVYLLGDVEGKYVADLCAAPGGKTMQLAAMGAQVVAVDRSAKRLQRLEENLERTALSDYVHVEVADSQSWRPSEDGVDMILLDAPCSATGTVRRHPDLVHLKSLQDLPRLVSLQASLLDHSASLLDSGGLIVYCTCSLQKEEGEAQINAFLDRHNDFQRMPVSAQDIGGIEEAITPDGDVRILPFYQSARGGMDGFFIARLQKK